MLKKRSTRAGYSGLRLVRPPSGRTSGLIFPVRVGGGCRDFVSRDTKNWYRGRQITGLMQCTLRNHWTADRGLGESGYAGSGCLCPFPETVGIEDDQVPFIAGNDLVVNKGTYLSRDCYPGQTDHAGEHFMGEVQADASAPSPDDRVAVIGRQPGQEERHPRRSFPKHHGLEQDGKKPLLSRDASQYLQHDVGLGPHCLEGGLSGENPDPRRLHRDSRGVIGDPVEAGCFAEQASGFDDGQDVLATVLVPVENTNSARDELVELMRDFPLLIDEDASGELSDGRQVTAELAEPAFVSQDGRAGIVANV